MTKKCSHKVHHKEVLGHVLCVCCSHCQKENEKLKEENEGQKTWIGRLEADLEEQCLLLGKSGSREAKLLTEIEEWKKWTERLVSVVHESRMQATRRKRATGGKEYLVVDLQLIEQRCEKVLSDFQKFKEGKEK